MIDLSGIDTYGELVKRLEYADTKRIPYKREIRCSLCDMEAFVELLVGQEIIHLCMPHSVHYEDALEAMRNEEWNGISE